MGVKDKIKSIIKEAISDFGSPLNGGNLYEKTKTINAKDDVIKDFAHIELGKAIDSKLIAGLVKNKINVLVPNELIFFRNYANIFTSLLKFKCDDMVLSEQIIKMIRTAFYSGEAGLIIDGNKPFAVNVERYEHILNLRGDYEYVVVSNADKILQATKKPEKPDLVEKFKINYDSDGIATNFISLKWTAEAVSAWIWLWPYIKQIHQMQRQLALNTFFMNKKLRFKIKDPAMAKRDLELLVDPEVPAFIDISGDNPLSNKVEWMNEGVEQSSDILNYINGWNQLINDQFGLRGNSDKNVNKDRSLVAEVEASQSFYDNIEYALLREWDLFIRKMQKLGFNIQKIDEEEVNNENSQSSDQFNNDK